MDEETTTTTPAPEYEKAGARHSAQDRKDMQDLHDISVRQGAMCATRKADDEPFDNAIKAISKTDTELRVGNYIVLFGGRDLTGHVLGKNTDGSMGEYFTPQTDLESEYTKTGVLHVDFEHGRDPDGVGNTKDNVLGYVDWKTAKADDRGVFVERVLNRRKRYVKYLESLIEAGLMGNSSEAVGSGVQKADDGQIVKWPLRRDTLTVSPMEPRMLTQNALTALKALSAEFPNLKSLLPPAEEDTALTDPETSETKSIDQLKQGVSIMEQNEIDTAVEKAVAEALAKREAEQKAEAEKVAALKAAEDAGYKKAVEDLKKVRPARYHSTEKTSDSDDGVSAFKSWMITGETNSELIAPDSSFDKIQSAKTAWNVTTGASGGFLVPDPLYNQIIAKRNLASWARQAPVSHFQTDADHLLVPQESTSHTAFTLTAEAGSYNEDEGTIAQKDLVLYKYTKMEKVSEEFLMYNTTNWETWLSSALGRAEAVTENTIFTNGTGTGQPQGIAAGATVTGIAIKTSTQLNPEDLTSIIGKLGAGYNVTSECGFLMANVSKWYLKNAILAGPFAFAGGSFAAGAPDFFGYNAYTSDDMPAYTSSTNTDKVLLFGNMTYYGIVEKPGMIVQRNPYLYMANGQIGIFASIFRGGGVLQAEAIYYHVAK